MALAMQRGDHRREVRGQRDLRAEPGRQAERARLAFLQDALELAGGHRYGHWRGLGRSARDDRDRRAWDIPDGRICGPCLLRGDSGCHLGHSTRWSFHRSPDPDVTRGYPFDGVSQSWRHENILLLPCSPTECFDMAGDAFDLAEQFQTLIFVMSDLDLGMNNWMSEPFKYPEKPIKRGKVLDAEALGNLGSFARYKDIDGDGVGYRTLPGTDHPAAAYFTRGSGHNEKSQYSERPDDFEKNMERINRKFETARSFVPRPEVLTGKSKIGIIAYGTSHWAIIESRDQLRKE